MVEVADPPQVRQRPVAVGRPDSFSPRRPGKPPDVITDAGRTMTSQELDEAMASADRVDILDQRHLRALQSFTQLEAIGAEAVRFTQSLLSDTHTLSNARESTNFKFPIIQYYQQIPISNIK